MRLPHPPLLIVTDRKQARRPLPEILESAFAAGCRWASLREKDLPVRDQLELLRELLPLARRHGAALTLHGDPSLAQEAGADGVHLPGGGDAVAARALLGSGALIGISIHAVAEARQLDARALDYAIAGPVFETVSKPGYGPSLGEAGLAAMAKASPVPLIGIGGIDALSVKTVIAAGAHGAAVMGGVMRASDSGAKVRALLAAFQPFAKPD